MRESRFLFLFKLLAIYFLLISTSLRPVAIVLADSIPENGTDDLFGGVAGGGGGGSIPGLGGGGSSSPGSGRVPGIGGDSPSDGVNPGQGGFGGGEPGGGGGDYGGGGNYGGGSGGSGGLFGGGGGAGGGLLGGGMGGILQFLLGFLMGGMMSQYSQGSKQGEQPIQYRVTDASGNILTAPGEAVASALLGTDRIETGQLDQYFGGVSAGEATANQKADAKNFKSKNQAFLKQCMEPKVVGTCCVVPGMPLIPPVDLYNYFYPMMIYESPKAPVHSRLIDKNYISQQRDQVAQLNTSKTGSRVSDALGVLGGGSVDASNSNQYASDIQNSLKSVAADALGLTPRQNGVFYVTAHALPANELLSKESKHDLAKKLGIREDQFDKLPDKFDDPPVGFDFRNGYEYIIDPDKISLLSNSKSKTDPAKAYQEWKSDPNVLSAATPDRQPNPLEVILGSRGGSFFFPGKNYGLAPFGTYFGADKGTSNAFNAVWQISAVSALLPGRKENLPILELSPYARKDGQIVSDKILPQIGKHLPEQCFKGPKEPFMYMEEWGDKAQIEQRDNQAFQGYIGLMFGQSCPPGYIIDPTKDPRCMTNGDPLEYYGAFRKPLL